MAEESIVGGGEGSEEWSLAAYQGLDKNGNALWSFDKSGNLTLKGALISGSSVVGAGANVALAGALTVATTLGVTGTTTAAAINASGTVAAAALTVGTTLGVTGTSTLAAVNASGTVAAAGALTVGTTLGVTGTSTLAAVSATSGTFSGIIFETGIETPITAHSGGTQAAAFSLSTTKPIHVVTTVAAGNDSVKLPSATGSGACHVISNQAATNSLQVFGSGTDTINAVATATGVAIAAGKTSCFYDYAAGLWFGQASA